MLKVFFLLISKHIMKEFLSFTNLKIEIKVLHFIGHDFWHLYVLLHFLFNFLYLYIFWSFLTLILLPIGERNVKYLSCILLKNAWQCCYLHHPFGPSLLQTQWTQLVHYHPYPSNQIPEQFILKYSAIIKIFQHLLKFSFIYIFISEKFHEISNFCIIHLSTAIFIKLSKCLVKCFEIPFLNMIRLRSPLFNEV